MSKILDSVAVAVQANEPLALMGSPGSGKTATIEGVAESLGWTLETLIGSVLDPTDVGGMPHLSKDMVSYAQPSWFRRLMSSEGPGILYLDEISDAPMAVQAPLMRLVLAGVAGEHQLPKAIRRIAAFNPPESSATGQMLAPPLWSRFVTLTYEPELETYLTGTVQGWMTPQCVKLPEQWEQFVPGTTALVTGFLKRHHAVFMSTPPAAGGPHPTPRSWSRAIRLMAAAESVQLEPWLLVEGTVGHAAAMELRAFKADLKLPNPADILSGKEPLPERGDLLYVAATGAIALALSNLTLENYNLAWEVVLQVSKRAKDLAVATSKPLINVPQDRLPEGSDWPAEAVKIFSGILPKAA